MTDPTTPEDLHRLQIQSSEMLDLLLERYPDDAVEIVALVERSYQRTSEPEYRLNPARIDAAVARWRESEEAT